MGPDWLSPAGALATERLGLPCAALIVPLVLFSSSERPRRRARSDALVATFTIGAFEPTLELAKALGRL